MGDRGPVAGEARRDLEHPCETIDRRRDPGVSSHEAIDPLEFAEVSHAAHRALLTLRGWTPGFGPADCGWP